MNNLQEAVHYYEEEWGDHMPRGGATAEALKALERMEVTERLVAASALSSRGNECAVCVCEFKQKEVLVLLKCTHVYHEDCLLPWLKRSGTCPTCRAAVVK